MSTFDIFLLIPLGIGAVQGYRRGLVLEVATLLALVLGVVGGLALLNDAIPLVRHYVGEAFGLLPLVSFVLVFAAIGWGVHLLSGLLKTAVHLTPLGFLDNLGGAIGGMLKWVLGLSLLLYGVEAAGVPLISPALAADSQVLPFVRQATPAALQIVGFVMPFASTLLTRLREVF
ncbi:CvpA family protein [Hymenobacter actinosclerus]|uniref:Membrane protein required for colicin V production n=1 Tax=Hymenobacter actinosclerus TaxID=82805 RepID=A0A1I0IAL7_9BACT|nr:CvpA family protein [Hymenobacter actinosclerus]SET93694.1 membrane protein required for colicin V production [Hymenobacter actinosclerus]